MTFGWDADNVCCLIEKKVRDQNGLRPSRTTHR